MLTAPSSAEVLPFQARQKNGYLKLEHSFLDSSAWLSLTAVPRALYVEIARRHNGRNNGHVPYSVRDGGMALGVHSRTIRRAFKQLEEQGIAVRTNRGSFNLKTKEAKASEWYLPHLAKGTPGPPAADTRATSNAHPADTRATLVDKRITIDENFKDFGLPRGPSDPKGEQARQWLAEGKSEFTGIPKKTPLNGSRPTGRRPS
jgi:hypothetical protein